MVRGEADHQREEDAENQKGQKDRGQKIAASGLGECELRHLQEDSKGRMFSGR
jgi:hypothetical protein